MITVSNQRWRDQRDSYRPKGETINTRAYEVAYMAGDKEAKAFVLRHHYSASFPAARFRYGLYRGGRLAGVAVFSVPAQPRCLDVAPGERGQKVELGRFVLLDNVEANGESWFIARCFDQLRAAGLTGVVSFSDPSRRTNAQGDAVFGGHVGTIYQATNATYLGTSKAETRRLLPDGTVIHGRALTKIRHRRQGHRYAAAQLERFGAEPLRDSDDAVAWTARWVGELTRPLRHPGNHKYVWALHKRDRRHLPAGLPYPKMGVPS
jgi:hypothetical protein